MPRLSAWFIRSALIYLLLGFTLGALLLWNKGAPIHPALWRTLPAHMEFLLLGWTVELAIGVAYWVLPRFRSERRRTGLVWLTFILLNVGIWLVALGNFTQTPGFMQLAGRIMEVCAVIAFVVHAWPRIKPSGAL